MAGWLRVVKDVSSGGETVAVTARRPEVAAIAGFDARFAKLFDLGYRVAFRVLGCRDDAVDVAQEALARAERRWVRLADRPDPWVAKVAYNLAVGVWRKQHRHQPISAAPAAVVGNDDEHAAERLDLIRALQRLSRRQRQVVVLRYLADQSEEDVAAVLGCSVGSVKTHASRGLNALRQGLGGEP